MMFLLTLFSFSSCSFFSCSKDSLFCFDCFDLRNVRVSHTMLDNVSYNNTLGMMSLENGAGITGHISVPESEKSNEENLIPDNDEPAYGDN